MTFSFPVDIRQSDSYPLPCRISRGAYGKDTNRFVTGNARSAGAQDASNRADSRMGHCAEHTADFAGCAAGGPGIVVSGAAPAGSAGLDRYGVGGVGEQPEGQILQTDRRRPETIVGGDRDLETIHRGGRIDSENVLNGRIWPCSTS